MDDETIADSDGFDMEGAQEDLAADLFDAEPEAKDDLIDEIVPEETGKETVEETTTEEVLEGRTAPSSWRKEMHERWNTLDPEMQDYIEKREEQMRDGLDTNKADSTLGRDIRDTINPYMDLLSSQKLTEASAIKYLMNAHAKLSNAPADQKQALLEEFGKAYGVGTTQQVDPALQAMQSRLSEMENYMTTSQQHTLQVAQEKIVQDVEKFASDPAHPYFDELETEIASLIKAGFDLDEAYEKAVWVNPVTRQKENDRRLSEAEKAATLEAKQKTEKAKKAKAVNVRSRDTQNAPTEPTGTMDDTMRETLLEIQNRN